MNKDKIRNTLKRALKLKSHDQEMANDILNGMAWYFVDHVATNDKDNELKDLAKEILNAIETYENYKVGINVRF